MDIEINPSSETRREVVITFSAEDLASEEKDILREFGRQAKIPGFRPGKAPEHLLRKRFDKEIREEMQRKILRSGYERMEKEKDFEPLNIVEIDDPDLNSDPPATLKLVVDIKPTFDLPEYKGISLEKESSEISEEEVDRAVEQAISRHAEFNKVDRAAETGDYVRCSYDGKIDGESIAEKVEDRPMYGTQTGTWEEAGAEDAPGITEIAVALVGMKEGDRKTVEASFPEDFDLEFLRGKTVTYDLEVLEVRERKLPELTEEFLKNLGVESEEQLREQTSESLRAQKEQANDGKLRQQVTQRLAESLEFPLPESLVSSETNQILTNYMGRQMQQGASEEDFEKNREALFASASDEARKKVKLDLILDEIAEAEKIEVSEEDMSNFLYSYSMQVRRSPDDIVKELQKDRSKVADIQRNIRRSKAVGKVVELGAVEGQPTESGA